MEGPNVNLTTQTVDRLVDLISASGLRPGDTFAREADLEKQLNVSRPVLREAVSRLRALGILDSRQCRGLIVSQPDPVGLFSRGFQNWMIDSMDLQELAELRYTLEIGAVELVALRATREQLAKLVALGDEFSRQLATQDAGRSLDDIELDFHGTILAASHNSMLMRMHQVISAYFHRCAKEVAGWDTHGSTENSAWEHRAIAQALTERNVERARALLAGHLSHLISDKNKSE